MLLNKTRLNFVMGDVSRLPFERRIAPCSDDRMKSPTSLHLKPFGEVARLHGGLQASFQRILNDVENLDQAAPDRLVVSGDLGRVGAVQTAILHSPLFQEGLIGIDVGFEPPQRLQVGVIERFGEYLPRKSEIQIEYLNAECFLRGEVVAERALGHACGFDYVAHTRAGQTSLVHDPKPIGQNFVSVRRLSHVSNTRSDRSYPTWLTGLYAPWLDPVGRRGL